MKMSFYFKSLVLTTEEGTTESGFEESGLFVMN